jgi:hypothetical protein
MGDLDLRFSRDFCIQGNPHLYLIFSAGKKCRLKQQLSETAKSFIPVPNVKQLKTSGKRANGIKQQQALIRYFVSEQLEQMHRD